MKDKSLTRNTFVLFVSGFCVVMMILMIFLPLISVRNQGSEKTAGLYLLDFLSIQAAVTSVSTSSGANINLLYGIILFSLYFICPILLTFENKLAKSINLGLAFSLLATTIYIFSSVLAIRNTTQQIVTIPGAIVLLIVYIIVTLCAIYVFVDQKIEERYEKK